MSNSPGHPSPPPPPPPPPSAIEDGEEDEWQAATHSYSARTGRDSSRHLHLRLPHRKTRLTPSESIRQDILDVCLSPARRAPTSNPALLLAPTWFLPTDASAHGPALDHHLLLNLLIALALLALAHLILS